MGQIEKILTAADPLISENPRHPARYYADREMMVFLASNKKSWGLGFIVMCFSMKEPIRFYYTVCSNNLLYFYPELSKEFITSLGEFVTKRKYFVFSGRNVFRYLRIGEPPLDRQAGPLENLHALCLTLRETQAKTANGFSRERFEETFAALHSMKENDEEEIGRLIEEMVFRT
jgi:hypothetical protein